MTKQKGVLVACAVLSTVCLLVLAVGYLVEHWPERRPPRLAFAAPDFALVNIPTPFFAQKCRSRPDSLWTRIRNAAEYDGPAAWKREVDTAQKLGDILCVVDGWVDVEILEDNNKYSSLSLVRAELPGLGTQICLVPDEYLSRCTPNR